MSENETKKTDYIDTAITAGVKKAAESLLVRAVDKSIEYCKTQTDQLKVKTGTAYMKYLDNAYLRLNQMKTLATGLDTVSILGENSVYVNMSVHYENFKNGITKDIDVISVEDLLAVGNNILIVGTGGAGKTMMMKYLFLNTKNRDSFVPVFLELRKVSAQTSGKISIPELIYTCMKDYDVDMSKEMLEYSLQYGGYLFLFDGFDEIKDALADETATAIQQFSAKYPNNAYIVTSRKRNNLPMFQTFSVVETMPMDIQKAKELAHKLGGDTAKNESFCKELETKLFDKHKDFAENPLLLTMMFLVHMRNGSVPDYLADFYSKCFDALYSVHDSHHKDNYKREFQCKNLTEQEFKRIFSSFCFATYFREEYEFEKDKILAYLTNCISKNTKKEVTAEDYLKDLRDAVCILVKDGDTYKFAHRTFQAYFAAIHTCMRLTDEEMKKIVGIFMNKTNMTYCIDYYDLCYQINPEQFGRNMLEPTLRDLLGTITKHQYPELEFLRMTCGRISRVFTPFRLHSDMDNPYGRAVYLFSRLIAKTDVFEIRLKDYSYRTTVDALCQAMHIKVGAFLIKLSFKDIEKFGQTEPKHKMFWSLKASFYKSTIKHFCIIGLCNEIKHWLAEQKKKVLQSQCATELNDMLDTLI